MKGGEITTTDDGAFHEDDCLMEYLYNQFVYRYSREGYEEAIRELEKLLE